MRVMIHACPDRLWYVNEFLVPDLTDQGVTEITVWNDERRQGNLRSCMAAFASCTGDGGTWHIQDDALIASDFAERAADAQGDRIVCGFVSDAYGPDPTLKGEVYMADMWNSFLCIYIPDRIARECAEWYSTGAWKKDATADLWTLHELGSGDDWFFREYMQTHHGRDKAINLAPNLVDHIDWMIGGSIDSRYREFTARAAWFADADRVEQLQQRITERKLRS